MIVVKMLGGLGNQLFQLAYAINLAAKNDKNIYLDISVYNKYKIRSFALDEFELNKRIKIFDSTLNYKFQLYLKLTQNSYHIWQKIIKTFGGDYQFGGILFHRLSKYGLFYNFDNYFYNVDIPNDKVISVYGYFQSEKYFLDSIDEVKKCFYLSDDIFKDKSVFNLIKEKKSIAISLRLGDDYLNSKELNVCTTDYYINSLNYFKNKYKGCVFFIFSDCINRAKNIFKDYCDVIYIEGFSDYQSLKLMSMCNHFIISNSSFSWWGAYLSDFKDKEIICPDIWYNHINGNVDIYYAGMTKYSNICMDSISKDK